MSRSETLSGINEPSMTATQSPQLEWHAGLTVGAARGSSCRSCIASGSIINGTWAVAAEEACSAALSCHWRSFAARRVRSCDSSRSSSASALAFACRTATHISCGSVHPSDDRNVSCSLYHSGDACVVNQAFLMRLMQRIPACTCRASRLRMCLQSHDNMDRETQGRKPWSWRPQRGLPLAWRPQPCAQPHPRPRRPWQPPTHAHPPAAALWPPPMLLPC